MRLHRKHQELLKKRLAYTKKKSAKTKEHHNWVQFRVNGACSCRRQLRQLCLITCLACVLQVLLRTPGGVSDFASLSKGNPEPWPKSWQIRKGITDFPTICLLSVILSLHTCSANELTQLSSFFQRSSKKKKKNQLSGSNSDTFLRKSGGGQWEAMIMLVQRYFPELHVTIFIIEHSLYRKITS